MITSLLWVSKGVFRPLPRNFLDEEEVSGEIAAAASSAGFASFEEEREAAMRAFETAAAAAEDDGLDGDVEVDVDGEAPEAGGSDLETAREDSGSSKKKAHGKARKARREDDQSIVDRYRLDEYDEEVADVVETLGAPVAYLENRHDALLRNDVAAEDSDDVDDFTLRPTDCMLVTASVDEDLGRVDVRVYEADAGNLYVHHDMLLPAFPLAVEWLDFVPRSDPAAAGGRGNFVAVSTFHPTIELWDLDVVNSPEPSCALGEHELLDPSDLDHIDLASLSAEQRRKVQKALKKHRQKSKRRAKAAAAADGTDGHADAVLGLSWNSLQRSVLASGSADRTVKLWDLATLRCMQTYRMHQNKVQCVAWNPREPSVLVSGDLGGRVLLYDVRAPAQQQLQWQLAADVTAVVWDPARPERCAVACEDGSVSFVSAAAPGAVESRVQAHRQGVTGLHLHPAVPGLMGTVSEDGHLRLWDVRPAEPALVHDVRLKLGELFCLRFSADEPTLLAVGGHREVKVVDLTRIEGLGDRFRPNHG